MSQVRSNLGIYYDLLKLYNHDFRCYTANRMIDRCKVE